MISPPKNKTADRFLDCQEAIDSRLQDLVAEAVGAGWSEPMVLAAVIEVAENLALGMGANADLEALLRLIRE